MIEIDLAQNWSECSLEILRTKIAPYGTVDRVSDVGERMISLGMGTSRPFGQTRITIFVQPDDLTPAGMTEPPEHRYWMPALGYPDYYRRRYMSLAPKAHLYISKDARPGSPMLVRFYFYSRKERMDKLFSFTEAGFRASASEVVNVVEPILPNKTIWRFPVWHPLPAVLPEHPVSRLQLLMSHI